MEESKLISLLKRFEKNEIIEVKSLAEERELSPLFQEGLIAQRFETGSISGERTYVLTDKGKKYFNKINPELVFAKIRDKAYMAALNLDYIIADAKNIYPEIPENEIELVDRQSIPEEFKWSARRVEEFDNWERKIGKGYLLISNYENHANAPELFPELKNNNSFNN